MFISIKHMLNDLFCSFVLVRIIQTYNDKIYKFYDDNITQPLIIVYVSII